MTFMRVYKGFLRYFFLFKPASSLSSLGSIGPVGWVEWPWQNGSDFKALNGYAPCEVKPSWRSISNERFGKSG